jgi:hypothetical protein
LICLDNAIDLVAIRYWDVKTPFTIAPPYQAGNVRPVNSLKARCGSTGTGRSPATLPDVFLGRSTLQFVKV